MNFKENLRKLADKMDDVVAIAIGDMDGIILEEYKTDPLFDIASLVAEYSGIWRTVDKASLSLDLGASQEISILTEKTAIIVKKINQGYFLLLAARSEKNFGKGRFLVKKEIATLVAEL
jgi:predicted regulator of Ras-like GTPase activity (Roadblock/LC7/MglB family)